MLKNKVPSEITIPISSGIATSINIIGIQNAANMPPCSSCQPPVPSTSTPGIHGVGRSNYCQLVMPFGQAYPHQRQVKAAPRASNPLQAVTTVVNTNQDSSIRKDKYFEVAMKVDDTELDRYGVVHNAVYSSYIQNGHDKLFESLGISVDAITSKGKALAISEVHLKYIAPLRVKLRQIKGVRVIFAHTIETLPDHKLVLEAKGTVVCLDKDHRPTRVFPEMSTKILQFFSSKDD